MTTNRSWIGDTELPVWPDRTPNVQHGIQSWVDYQKPWASQRQFLVTESQANNLSNLVAILLTLAGPRLWILIRELFVWISQNLSEHHWWSMLSHSVLGRWKSPNNSPPAKTDNPANHTGYKNNRDIVEKSHTELGAALRILLSIFQANRKVNQCQGPASSQSRAATEKLSDNLRLHPAIKNCLDVLFSVLLAILLLALFATQATGAVLSSRILGDNTGVARNPLCEAFPTFASGYVDEWPSTEWCGNGTSRCYTPVRPLWPPTPVTRRRSVCPLEDGSCLTDIVTSDSGHVRIQGLGWNSPNDFAIRTVVSCFFVSLESAVAERASSSNQSLVNILPESMQRCEHNALSGGIQFDSRLVFNEVDLANCAQIAWQNSSDGHELPDDLITVQAWSVEGLVNEISLLSRNTSWSPALVCRHNAQYCDEKRVCHHVPLAHSLDAVADVQNQVLSPYNEHSQSPDIEHLIIPVLLTGVYLSSQNAISRRAGSLRPKFQPNNNISFSHFLRAEELQLWAEDRASGGISSFQNLLIDLIKDRDLSRQPGATIPGNLKRACRMVKFSTSGWRNVEAAPLIGLISLAASITLASTRGEDKRLYIIAASSGLWRVLQSVTGWCWKILGFMIKQAIFSTHRMVRKWKR